jgi:hypothetical protein
MVRVYGKEFSFPKKYALYSGMGIFAFVFVALIYSAFGRDPDGVSNFFQAFINWSETGSNGNGHQKPFEYWIKVFSAYEWPTLVGLALSPLALLKMPSSVRLLSVMSVGVLLAYSIVSYKTPWCLLCFQWGFVLIFGYWCSRWWDHYRAFILILISVLGIHSLVQAHDVAFVNVDADDSYYIYGQTYRTLMPPISEILKKVEENPELKKTLRIQVLSAYTWPLPFLLGEINQAAYHSVQNAPERFDADYIFIDENLEQNYSSRIVGQYSRQVVKARQWASPMVILEKQ